MLPRRFCCPTCALVLHSSCKAHVGNKWRMLIFPEPLCRLHFEITANYLRKRFFKLLLLFCFVFASMTSFIFQKQLQQVCFRLWAMLWFCHLVCTKFTNCLFFLLRGSYLQGSQCLCLFLVSLWRAKVWLLHQYWKETSVLSEFFLVLLGK